MKPLTFEQYNVEKIGDSQTPYIFYKTDIGNFLVMRRPKLDVNGNPLYVFHTQYSENLGFVRDLPPIEGARRNNIRQSYTMQSYNVDQSMGWLLERLDKQIKTGFRMHEKI